MEFLADILLLAGAAAAGGYCLILAQRLRRFTDLEKGMGAAVAVLSVQVDDLTKLLERSEGRATTAAASLLAASDRAEAAQARLDLMLAALHDLPQEAPAPRPTVYLRQNGGLN